MHDIVYLILCSCTVAIGYSPFEWCAEARFAKDLTVVLSQQYLGVVMVIAGLFLLLFSNHMVRGEFGCKSRYHAMQ